MKKAGVIPPTAAGTSGTFKSTGIFGGASRFKPSPNITAAEMFDARSASQPVRDHDDYFQSDCVEPVDLPPAQLSRVDLWSIVFYLVFLVFLGTRARALKSRVAELVDLAAFRAGLQRVSRKGKSVAQAAEPELEVAVNATDPASPQLPG